jgi:hypothetical protein
MRRCQIVAVETVGPAGFEPATCRGGDRTTSRAGRDHRDLVRFHNTALSSLLQRDSQRPRCALKSMERRGVLAWSGQSYAAGCAHRRSHTIRRSIRLSSCCAEHRHRTPPIFNKIGPAGFEPATCRRGDRTGDPTYLPISQNRAGGI